MNRFLLVLAAVLALALPSAAQAKTAKVYFTKGEQLAPVKRKNVDGGVAAAMGALLAGPTAKERKAGYGTAIPAGVSLTNTVVKGATVELTFSDSFATADVTYLARVAQVVYTAKAAGAAKVKIRGRTFTPADFGAPGSYSQPRVPNKKVSGAPKDVKGLQRKLAAIGYLPTDAVTGTYDYRTQQAVLAFQAWEGLDRDGVVGPQTAGRLGTAQRPVPLARPRRRHVEIYRQRGVVLLVARSKVVRAIHTSTGIRGDSRDPPTPPGRFRIYRKETRSWSIPNKVWLPFAAYWKGGWALHGYPDVPAHEASHGCARLPLMEAPVVFSFVSIGTPVRVI